MSWRWRRDWFAWLDRGTILIAEWLPLLIPPLSYGIAIGVSGWAATHRSLLAPMGNNELPHLERVIALGFVIVATAGIVATYVFTCRHRPAGTPRGTLAWLNPRLSALLALPLIAALAIPGLPHDRPGFTLLLIAGAAAVCVPSFWSLTSPVTVRWAPGAGPAPGRSPTWLRRWWPAWAVGGLWLAYGLFFSRLTLTNYFALQMRTTDLGLYDNTFYQSAHGHLLACSLLPSASHISNHFDPIIILFAPLYRLYPRAETLLILQSFWLGMGSVPAYLLGRHVLRTGIAGVVIAFAWVLQPALHGANAYEFHTLTLIAPLLVWLIYFFVTERNRAYGVTLLLLLLCREDVPLLLCGIGAYAVLAGRPRLGWGTLVGSLAYAGLARLVIMSQDVYYSYANYYSQLIPHGRGFGDMVLSLLTNPIYALGIAFNQDKLIFMGIVLLPFGFLPLFAKRARVTLVYGGALILLASRAAVFSIGFQYPVVIAPLALALVPLAIRRLGDISLPRFHSSRRRLQHCALGFVTVASVLTSLEFGAFIETGEFHGGFRPVVRRLNDVQQQRLAWLRQVQQTIAPDARVIVSPGVGPFFSNREHVFEVEHKEPADFLVADMREIEGEDLADHWLRVARRERIQVSHFEDFALYRIEGRERRSGDAGVPRQALPRIHESNPQPNSE